MKIINARSVSLPEGVVAPYWWPSGVILWLCSQSSQADRVKSQEQPHQVNIATRDFGLGLPFSAIPACCLGEGDFAFLLRMILYGSTDTLFYSTAVLEN